MQVYCDGRHDALTSLLHCCFVRLSLLLFAELFYYYVCRQEVCARVFVTHCTMHIAQMHTGQRVLSFAVVTVCRFFAEWAATTCTHYIRWMDARLAVHSILSTYSFVSEHYSVHMMRCVLHSGIRCSACWKINWKKYHTFQDIVASCY